MNRGVKGARQGAEQAPWRVLEGREEDLGFRSGYQELLVGIGEQRTDGSVPRSRTATPVTAWRTVGGQRGDRRPARRQILQSGEGPRWLVRRGRAGEGSVSVGSLGKMAEVDVSGFALQMWVLMFNLTSSRDHEWELHEHPVLLQGPGRQETAGLAHPSSAHPNSVFPVLFF